MKKFSGILLIIVGALFCLCAVLAAIKTVVPAAFAIFSDPTAYAWGRLVGSLLATALVYFAGAAVIRIGRRWSTA